MLRNAFDLANEVFTAQWPQKFTESAVRTMWGRLCELAKSDPHDLASAYLYSVWEDFFNQFAFVLGVLSDCPVSHTVVDGYEARVKRLEADLPKGFDMWEYVFRLVRPEGPLRPLFVFFYHVSRKREWQPNPRIPELRLSQAEISHEVVITNAHREAGRGPAAPLGTRDFELLIYEGFERETYAVMAQQKQKSDETRLHTLQNPKPPRIRPAARPMVVRRRAPIDSDDVREGELATIRRDWGPATPVREDGRAERGAVAEPPPYDSPADRVEREDATELRDDRVEPVSPSRDREARQPPVRRELRPPDVSPPLVEREKHQEVPRFRAGPSSPPAAGDNGEFGQAGLPPATEAGLVPEAVASPRDDVREKQEPGADVPAQAPPPPDDWDTGVVTRVEGQGIDAGGRMIDKRLDDGAEEWGPTGTGTPARMHAQRMAPALVSENPIQDGVSARFVITRELQKFVLSVQGAFVITGGGLEFAADLPGLTFSPSLRVAFGDAGEVGLALNPDTAGERQDAFCVYIPGVTNAQERDCLLVDPDTTALRVTRGESVMLEVSQRTSIWAYGMPFHFRESGQSVGGISRCMNMGAGIWFVTMLDLQHDGEFVFGGPEKRWETFEQEGLWFTPPIWVLPSLCVVGRAIEGGPAMLVLDSGLIRVMADVNRVRATLTTNEVALRPIAGDQLYLLLLVCDDGVWCEMIQLEISTSLNWPGLTRWFRKTTVAGGMHPELLWCHLEEGDLRAAAKVVTGVRQAIAVQRDCVEHREILRRTVDASLICLMDGFGPFMRNCEFLGVGVLPPYDEFLEASMKAGRTEEYTMDHYSVLAVELNFYAGELVVLTGRSAYLNRLEGLPEHSGLWFSQHTLDLMGGGFRHVIPWEEGPVEDSSRDPTDVGACRCKDLVGFGERLGISHRHPNPEILFAGLFLEMFRARWGMRPKPEDFPTDRAVVGDLPYEESCRRVAGTDFATCLAAFWGYFKLAVQFPERGPNVVLRLPEQVGFVDVPHGVNAVIHLDSGVFTACVLSASALQVMRDGSDEVVPPGHEFAVVPGLQVLWVMDRGSSKAPTRLTIRPRSVRGLLTFYDGAKLIANVRLVESPIRVDRDFRRVYDIQGELMFTWDGNGIAIRLWSEKKPNGYGDPVKKGVLVRYKQVLVKWVDGSTDLYFE
jgi:hypothetical protein